MEFKWLKILNLVAIMYCRKVGDVNGGVEVE